MSAVTQCKVNQYTRGGCSGPKHEPPLTLGVGRSKYLVQKVFIKHLLFTRHGLGTYREGLTDWLVGGLWEVQGESQAGTTGSGEHCLGRQERTGLSGQMCVLSRKNRPQSLRRKVQL